MGRLTRLPFLCREPGTGPQALAEYLGINVRQGLFYRHFQCLHNGSAINKGYGICKYFYYIDSYFFTLFM